MKIFIALAMLLWMLAACHSSRTREPPPPPPDATVVRSSVRPCPAEAPALPVLPGALPRHSMVEFWLTHTPAPAARTITAEQVAQHNQRVRALRTDGWPTGRWDLLELRIPFARVRQRLAERVRKFAEVVDQGKRVLPNGTPARVLASSLARQLPKLHATDELRLVRRGAQLRCFATDQAVYEKAWDEAFDLMQCSHLRLGEAVRVLARAGRYWYVWTSYSEGWVKPAALTPPLTAEQARRYLRPREFVVVQVDRLPLWPDRQRSALLGVIRMGTRLPLTARHKGWWQVTAPGPEGLQQAWLASTGATVGYPGLSREAMLRRAFSLLGSAYGWGGTGGNRDCSRFTMDLFQSFGVLLPRNSWHQSNAGIRQLDVANLDDAAKGQIIDQEARKGLVLLYLPGHVMLYLGRDGEQQYALHLFSGYLVPCQRGGETMRRVNRTVVTTLELGRGSSRRAFIQRITRLMVFN